MGLDVRDLIGISVLQKAQDAYSSMTGIAALTTDAAGNPITEGSCFSEFCTQYARASVWGEETV